MARLAAQSVLGKVIAGLQLAFSDAIRIDDVVVAEGEFCSAFTGPEHDRRAGSGGRCAGAAGEKGGLLACRTGGLRGGDQSSRVVNAARRRRSSQSIAAPAAVTMTPAVSMVVIAAPVRGSGG